MDSKTNQAIKQAAERINAFAGSAEAISYPSNGVPDKSRVIAITDQLRSTMFPGFFEAPAYCGDEAVTSYKLTQISAELERQALLAYRGSNSEQAASKLAAKAVQSFMLELPRVQELLYTDVKAIYMGDPAAQSEVEVVLSYPGLFAITVYRLAHVIYTIGVPLIPRIMTEYAHGQTGIDINAGAQIGSYFFIDHGTGVVIGETTVIGDYVKLYQGVTLGALSTRKGHKLTGIKRHPTLGNRVTVYSGASILGGDTVVGDDCLIGSNAFVTGSVPANTKVSLKAPEHTFRTNVPGLWEKE